jgi:drug/metabolite transporter, DME family
VGTGRAVLSVVLAAVLFGTAGTAAALGPPSTTPLAVGAVRLIAGGLTLLLVVGLAGGGLARVWRLWRSRPVLLASLAAAVYQLCFFAAVDAAGVGLGTLVTVGSGPIFAGLLAAVVLGHRPTPAWALATLVCVVGLVLRSWDVLGGSDPAGLLAGLVLALAAGLCSAVWTVSVKHELDAGGAPLELATASFAIGGLLLVPVLLAQPLGWLVQPSGVALALYLGVATMALANVSLARGLGPLSPGPVTTLMLSDPLVATLLGVAVLGEAVGSLAWVGLVLVFAGLVVQGMALARERPRTSEPLPAPAAAPAR